MDEGEVPDVVGSSVVNSPNFAPFRWLPDFSWVNFGRVNAEEKPETENTELVVNDLIHDWDFDANLSPVIPHQAFVISRAEMVVINNENRPALFKHGNAENQLFNDDDKARGDEINKCHDYTQNGDYNDCDDFAKMTAIHDINDGDDDSCSTTSEILISITDLQNCTLFETADAKELYSNDPSPNSGNMEKVMKKKSFELLDCTGSTQDQSCLDWQMTVSNEETGDMSVVKIGAGLFAVSCNDVEVAGEPYAMPTGCETDVGPTAVLSGAETFDELTDAMRNDDGDLTSVLDYAVSVTVPAAMAEEADISAEPITISDDEESIDITTTMANDNGAVDRPIATVNGDAEFYDGEYKQGLFPMANVAKRPAIAIAGSGDANDGLASKLNDVDCEVESVAAHCDKLAEKDHQHISDMAEDNKIDTSHCGFQNEKADSRFAEMEMEFSTELEASSLEDLETQQTESSINDNHRKEIEKILKTERLLFTVQQSLENDFQGNDLVFELLNDVQKLLHELHASQSLETRRIARKMELLGKYKEERSLLLYEGKLLKIRRRKLIGLSENHQQLYEKALSLPTQSETESGDRAVCNHSFSSARKPQEPVNTTIDNETIVDRNFIIKESNLKRGLNELSSSRKTVRFTLPDSVDTACQARKSNVNERDDEQQSQKVSNTYGSRLVHHKEKDDQLVPIECSTQASVVPISYSVTDNQIQADQAGSSDTNTSKKTTSNSLKRSNDLGHVATASKVLKGSGLDSNATQANAHASTLLKEFSEKISPQTSRISPDFVMAASSLTSKTDALAPLHKFSVLSAGDAYLGGAEKVTNSMPSSNSTIYEVVQLTSNPSGTSSQKAYKLPMPIATAALNTSTAKFTSEASGIGFRKPDVLEHNKLPVSFATTVLNRQSIAPQIYMYRFTSAPSLLSTHSATATSELRSPMTTSVFSCPSSLVFTGNYQQTNCKAISQPTGIYNIRQSLCHSLSAASVTNSNAEQKLQHMSVMPLPTQAQKVLQSGNLGGQIFNVNDRDRTGCTSEEVSIRAGCLSTSQNRNISRKISLKHLFDDKLIQPGVNVLSARCKYGQVFASITPSGHIKNDKGQIFKSIRAWYLDAIELDTASQATINSEVLYYGVPVKALVSGSKDLENSSQDSPTDDCLLTNSSKRSQMPTKHDEDLLKTISTKIGFLHLHSEAELEPCDKWVWSSDFTHCSPSWLETIDDWK